MRLVTRSALTIAALSFTASAAHAATTDANRSRGTADLSWSTRTPIIGPASDKLGGSTLAVQFSADLDPVKDPTKPLLAVDMKDVALEATWNDEKSIEILLVDSKTKDGTVTVEHTLAPHIKLFVDILGLNDTFDFNAESLIGDLPGSSWSYLGKGAATFEPWAMTNYGIVKVTGPALADAQLVSKPLEEIIGGTEPLIKGVLAFNATTSPTFNYATTEVTVGNGTPITKDKPSSQLPTTDKDFLELPMLVKGQITYEGSLFGRPTITVTHVRIGQVYLPVPGQLGTFEIGALGVELPYSSADGADKGRAPIPVTFQAVMVHIPLPNVKAANELDLGSVQIGDEVTKPSLVRNTGEMEAVLAIKSSNPQFKVVADKVMKAKEDVNLDISFEPTEEGEQEAEITVTSNDPNEPVQKIKVRGNGTKVSVPPAVEEPEPTGSVDNGCGCRTAPAPSNYAAFGAVGIALAAMLRRRRR